MNPIPDEHTNYAFGNNGNQFPPKTMLRFVTCIRYYTTVYCFNYATWKCGHCGWYPGELQGPPNIKCGSCGHHNYTDDPERATALIRIRRTDCGYGFDMIAQAGRKIHTRQDAWWNMRAKGMEELSICVGESK